MAGQNVTGPKLFSLREAEARLPEIREHLVAFQTLFVRYDSLRRDLAVLRLVGASGTGEGNPDATELNRKEKQAGELMRSIRAIQQQLTEMGCVVKSFPDGLVDFFALKEDRLVFLCWKQGEEGIRHWHTLEGGFTGRMPIESFRADGQSPAGG